MDANNPIYQNLQRFANEHRVIFQDKGKVGFGRPCVGFISQGGNYVDYEPISYADYEPILGFDNSPRPSDNITDAYHKHNCLAVLVRDENYDEALRQLNEWVIEMEAKGPVEIAEYETGAVGMQAMFSGVIGYAIRYKKSYV